METLTLLLNLVIILTITELLKNIFVNNYYVNFIFFKIIKNNSDYKDLFNCLFNFFFFLTFTLFIIWLLLYYPIFVILKIKLFLFLIPIIILNSFFLILLKFFNKKIFLLNTLIFFSYLILLFASYKINSFYICIIFFYLINLFQILIAILLLKNKISFKINSKDVLDLRNFYFGKKFVRFLTRSQLYKFFILILLIIFSIV
jgi:hypothetical protein